MKITVISGDGSKHQGRITLEYDAPVPIIKAIHDSGFVFYAPCGGRGVCGKCKVTIIENADAASGEVTVLACQTTLYNDTVIKLPSVDILSETTSTETITGNAELGAAIDIGTTTVAAAAVDLQSGKIIKTDALPNPQAAHGADVISRISYDSKSRGILTDEIRSTVAMLKRRIGVSGRSPSLIVGNTTMLHFYCGLDAGGIGVYPFTPTTLFGGVFSGEYIPRCVSGYFGADAISSFLAAEIIEKEVLPERSLICDIGTNGEVMYKRGDVLRCSSAAAGPALEGAGISCGMPAMNGAIDSAKIDDGQIICHVIGGGKARGICGSGLFDAIACMLSLGIIRKDGYLARPYEIAPDVFLTPADIRAFMLAKGALRACIEILTRGDDVNRVYISGGFGSGLSADSMIKTGVLPRRFEGKINTLGNGALKGAAAMLCSPSLRQRADNTASDAIYIEPSGQTGFEEIYIKSLDFSGD